MNKLLTLLMLGLFSAAIVGCEASAEVGDDDADEVTYKKTTVDRDDDSYKKTTTVREEDGDKKVTTEVKEY